MSSSVKRVELVRNAFRKISSKLSGTGSSEQFSVSLIPGVVELPAPALGLNGTHSNSKSDSPAKKCFVFFTVVKIFRFKNFSHSFY